MTIDTIIEYEINQLKDYLHEYCDNPLATASDNLSEILSGLDTDDIRWALSWAFISAHAVQGYATLDGDNIVLTIGEIEVSADQIEPDELDEVTIIGEYAYISLIAVELRYDLERLRTYVREGIC